MVSLKEQNLSNDIFLFPQLPSDKSDIYMPSPLPVNNPSWSKFYYKKVCTGIYRYFIPYSTTSLKLMFIYIYMYYLVVLVNKDINNGIRGMDA